MKCPVCKQSMKQQALTEGLDGFTCLNCEGNWVTGSKYYAWLEQRDAIEPVKDAAEGLNIESGEENTAKLCPSCSVILHKYRVGHDMDFSLDHCHGCGGIWFDRNEWIILKSRNLHDELTTIFTKAYQTKVRKEASRKTMKDMFATRFGKDYEEIQRIRGWPHEHPESLALLGYLTDPDPYEA